MLCCCSHTSIFFCPDFLFIYSPPLTHKEHALVSPPPRTIAGGATPSAAAERFGAGDDGPDRVDSVAALSDKLRERVDADLAVARGLSHVRPDVRLADALRRGCDALAVRRAGWCPSVLRSVRGRRFIGLPGKPVAPQLARRLPLVSYRAH